MSVIGAARSKAASNNNKVICIEAFRATKWLDRRGGKVKRDQQSLVWNQAKHMQAKIKSEKCKRRREQRWVNLGEGNNGTTHKLCSEGQKNRAKVTRGHKQLKTDPRLLLLNKYMVKINVFKKKKNRTQSLIAENTSQCHNAGQSWTFSPLEKPEVL